MGKIFCVEFQRYPLKWLTGDKINVNSYQIMLTCICVKMFGNIGSISGGFPLMKNLFIFWWLTVSIILGLFHSWIIDESADGVFTIYYKKKITSLELNSLLFASKFTFKSHFSWVFCMKLHQSGCKYSQVNIGLGNGFRTVKPSVEHRTHFPSAHKLSVHPVPVSNGNLQKNIHCFVSKQTSQDWTGQSRHSPLVA